MNKYYRIGLEAEPSIIGVTNGIMQVEITKNCFRNKNLYGQIFNFFDGDEYWENRDAVPKFDIELQCVRSLKNAKMTSFLSYGPAIFDCPFLISYEVKMCMEKFNIPKYRLYPANVSHKNNDLSYWLFNLPPLEFDVIDFQNCVFYSGQGSAKKPIHINDQTEYIKAGLLHKAKIVLNERFDKTLDLFKLKAGGMFVSERFMNEILSNGFTGVYFVSAFDGDPNQTMVEV